MWSYDYLVACIDKSIQDSFTVTVKYAACSPGRCQENQWTLVLFSVFTALLLSIYTLLHLIHIWDSNGIDLLLRKISLSFQFTYLILLEFSGNENGIIIVYSKHSINVDITCCMRNMHVVLYILGSLPLKHVQTRSS